MRFFDSLQNVLTTIGFGRRADSLQYGYAAADPQQYLAAYRANWMTKKAINIPAEDATREWREWQGDDAQVEAIYKEEARLQVRQKLRKAIKWSRLFGGAAILIGDGATDPSQPLRPDSLKRGGIRYLHAFHRFNLAAGELEDDMDAPGFGLPRFYTIASSRQQVRIHPSRFVLFRGEDIPSGVPGALDDGWGDSVLMAIERALKAADITAIVSGELVQEAKVDVFKFSEIMNHFATQDSEDRFMRRLTITAQQKSISEAIVLDKEDDYEQKQIKFDGLTDLLRMQLQIVSGAVDIPATRFIGQSPAGMNATGESDLRNYYDNVRSDQTGDITPAIATLDECLIRSALGARPDEIAYEWNPLWQQSPKEKAETAKATADALTQFAAMGVAPAEPFARSVQDRIIADGILPSLDNHLKAWEQDNGEWDFEEPEPASTDEEDEDRQQAQDAAPRTLYVHRKVKNAADIIAWAKDQGFETTLPADDLHVTIAYSRTPVDWMDVGEAWDAEMKIGPGGPRLVERFGEATVLLFGARELVWRHEDIKRSGASWDHSDYQPHITISYAARDLDLKEVEPYQGEIVLGPEVFEEVDEGWQARIDEA